MHTSWKKGKQTNKQTKPARSIMWKMSIYFYICVQENNNKNRTNYVCLPKCTFRFSFHWSTQLLA